MRLRLGWSPSDLARRLFVPSSSVLNWEKGLELPLQQHIQQLEFIEKEAEEQAEQLASESMADCYLSSGAPEQDQIDLGTLQTFSNQTASNLPSDENK